MSQNAGNHTQYKVTGFVFHVGTIQSSLLRHFFSNAWILLSLCQQSMFMYNIHTVG